MNVFYRSNNMLTVSLLILPDCSLMSVACTLDPMRAANRISEEAVFKWKILTLDGDPVKLTCGLPIAADAKFGEVAADDILIIIAGFDSETHARSNAVAKLVKLASSYRAIGGVEAGSLLMARTGMLNGFRATTHFEDLEDFAGDYPHIEVLPDRFVLDGRYFTSGGASPAFDMMLQLIRSRKGIAFAMAVASVFIYDEAHNATDAQNLISLGRIDNNEPVISAAIKLMETRLDEPISIQAIAKNVHMSVRGLEMLFVKIMQISPGKFYRQLRLQAARRMVIDTRLSVQQIAVRTGFNSSSAFSRAFRAQFDETPIKLRLKFYNGTA